jgi:electron transfer flavoprotein alpha subunit
LGADKVVVVDDEVLKDYQGDAYVHVGERICKEADPSVVLFGQTAIGRDLAPRLAARLGTAVAMDCWTARSCRRAGPATVVTPAPATRSTARLRSPRCAPRSTTRRSVMTPARRRWLSSPPT